MTCDEEAWGLGLINLADSLFKLCVGRIHAEKKKKKYILDSGFTLVNI